MPHTPITSHSPYSPVLPTSSETQITPSLWQSLYEKADSMLLRIALPPLAISAMLYSLIEYAA